jgi:alkanesulfonate monooxygenase SsuD/methylene tetrahydromethanopterin reductase-like flavin-dependent oxidoreductase (luciferase family)
MPTSCAASPTTAHPRAARRCALLAIGTAGSLPVRRTAEGLERIRAARTTHGRRTAEVGRMRVMVRLVELT